MVGDTVTDDPERELRDAMDEANAAIEQEFRHKSWWEALRTAGPLWWRMSVHVGQRWDAYRNARMALRKSIRGLRRMVRELSGKP